MATNNGLILKEILEMAKSGELPTKVSNRVLLAAILQNTNSISTLADRESTNEKRIGSLDKLVKFLSALMLALLGWTVSG